MPDLSVIAFGIFTGVIGYIIKGKIDRNLVEHGRKFQVYYEKQVEALTTIFDSLLDIRDHYTAKMVKKEPPDIPYLCYTSLVHFQKNRIFIFDIELRNEISGFFDSLHSLYDLHVLSESGMSLTSEQQVAVNRILDKDLKPIINNLEKHIREAIAPSPPKRLFHRNKKPSSQV